MLLTARTRATREGRAEEREPFRFGMMVATKIESEIALAKRCALGFIKSAYAGPSAAGCDMLSNVPWLAVFRVASAESCLPALCDCILSHDSELGEVRSLLKLFSERGRDEKASLVRILNDTVARLRAEGVPVIALKGAAFLASSDLYTRSMLDIDVLIRPDDKNKAVGILLGNGYSVLTRDGPYDRSEHHHAPPMLDPSKTIPIEIHTRLSPNSNKDPVLVDVIFESSSTCFVIPIPHDTHRVVHLILHAMVANSGYWLGTIRIRDLLDLLEIQKAGRVDWEQVRIVFEKIGYERRAASFLMAAELLLSPAFRAPDWAVKSRSWAARAVRAYFDPEAFRWRRVFGRFFADVELLAESPRRLGILFSAHKLTRFFLHRYRALR